MRLEQIQNVICKTKIKKDFKAEKISDSETLSIIQEVYKKEKFIIDPHTATAFGAINKIRELKDTVALGTAHPYKFLETVKKWRRKRFFPFSFVLFTEKPFNWKNFWPEKNWNT